MLTMTDAYKEITRLVTGRVRLDEPLAPFTTWRVGGPADIMVEPASFEEMLVLITLMEEGEVPYTVLGGGSNILVPDDGFRGAVVLLRHAAAHIEIHGDRVTAGAGVRMARLLQETAVRSLSGFEPLCGIPGTVGGAIAGNAGVPGMDIAALLERVTVITRTGERISLRSNEIENGYRYSSVGGYGTVWEAEFKLLHDSHERINTVIRKRMRHRMTVQPLNRRTAGSVFRNPEGAAAGKLLDECGCKGLVRGGAAVSDLHANFIINNGNARATDIRALMNDMAARVLDARGIILVPEVKELA